MDAVERAAEALGKDEALAQLAARSWPPDAPDHMRRRLARAVLDAVGYDALLDLLKQLAWVSGAKNHPAKMDGECGFCGLDPCPYGRAQAVLGDDDDEWGA